VPGMKVSSWVWSDLYQFKWNGPKPMWDNRVAGIVDVVEEEGGRPKRVGAHLETGSSPMTLTGWDGMGPWD